MFALHINDTEKPGWPQVHNMCQSLETRNAWAEDKKSICMNKNKVFMLNNDVAVALLITSCLYYGVHFEGHYVITLHYACLKLF